MTVRKQYPARSYETFTDSENTMAESPTSYQRGGDADKSRSAAAEARRLASQGSWADSFGGSPATIRTPIASTVDGNEERNVHYPDISQDDPSDPPPVYTPSASTQVASQSPATPASPVVARSAPAPVSEPVSAPSTESPSLHPRPSQGSLRHDVEEGASSLPEAVQHDHHEHHNHHDEDSDSDTLPVFLQQQQQQDRRHKRPWCRGARKARHCGGHRHGFGLHNHDKRRRARRIKKTCVFLLALLACLWLLIPGLCKSFKNDGRYQLPNLGTEPKPDPWPPEKHEHREHETSRSISGTYQLYDLLDLSTTSGSISVTVEVQAGEKPAVLRLSSTSGSVTVRMTSGGGLFKKPIVSDTARSRVLQTEISTKAGSVTGSVVHGNGGTTSISTNSGSITLDVYAVGVSEMDAVSNLTTISNSGSQHIKVYSDVTNTEPIRAIEATHTVRGSGSMDIQYPNKWEGMVHVGAYGSGSITARGQGLVVRKESSHELYGYKGPREGRKVEIAERGSGSVRFSC